ncbi:MAG TPA: hypothetical protein VLE73_03940 [Candidatus Saccharimonadales bacterium]|nr:hypothetical protein [Candidatus Saccharimonadales bacterium]
MTVQTMEVPSAAPAEAFQQTVVSQEVGAAFGRTALEMLAQPVEVPGIDASQPQQPPQTPPTPFPTEGGATPYDAHGNPDINPPDQEWLYE